MTRPLLILFTVALALRVLYVASVKPRPADWDDSTQWNKVALRFMSGTGFLTNTADLDPKRPPLYPLFLAATYSVSGAENVRAVKFVQAFLGALACVLFFFLVRCFFEEKFALAASAVLAFYPPLIVYVEILQSETLYILLFLAFLLLWMKSLSNPSWQKFAGAGALLGLLNLCKGTMFFFPLWILPWALLQKEGRWDRFLKHLLLVAVCLAVTLPWTWRNYKVYGGLMPTAAGGAEQLWSGTLPWEEQRLFGDSEIMQRFNTIADPVEREKTFTRNAIANIKADPGAYVKLTIHKAWFFWFQPIGQKLAARKSAWAGAAAYLIHGGVIVLCFCGLVMTLGRWRELAPLYLLLAYTSLLHIALAPEPRYRLPIEPLILMFALLPVMLQYTRRAPSPNYGRSRRS